LTVPINPDGTVPSDPEGNGTVTPPDPEVFDDQGVIYGAAFSALNSRTQENVTASLQAQLSANPIWDGLFDAFWELLRIPADFLLSVLEKLFPGIDWEALREFNLFDTIEDLVTGAVDALKEVPFLSDVIFWITGLVEGTRETVELWFGNLRDFLSHINLFSEDFNLIEAAESFVEFVLFPVWRVLPWDFVRDFLGRLFPGVDWSWITSEEFDISDIGQGIIDAVSQIPFIGDLLSWLTGATSGTLETLRQWFDNLRQFLASINFFGPDFDLLAAAEDFIQLILAPVNAFLSFDWFFDFLETIFPGLDWDALRELDAASFLSSVLAALQEVPFVGKIVTGILGLGSGTWEQLTIWFDNFWDFLGNINFLSPDFNLLEAAENFLEFIIFPVWRLVPWEWIVDVLQTLFPGLDWTWLETLDISEWAEQILSIIGRVPFVGDILFWLTGATAGTFETLKQWFDNLREFLGYINFFGPDFDLLAAAEAFIDFILFPVGKLAELGVGLLDWLRDRLVKPVLSALMGEGVNLDLTALGVWAKNLLSGEGPIPAQNLQGQVSSSLFGVIPVAHISNTSPNLLSQGNFDSADMVEANDVGWEWTDEESQTGTGGSLKLNLDNTVQIIYCNQSIPVGPGDKVALQGWLKTVDYSGVGEPFLLDLIPFAGQAQLAAEGVAESGPSPVGDWKQFYGSVYQVPAGVDSVRVRIVVAAGAYSGTAYFDDIRVAKTGFLQQGLVERLTDAWNNFWNGVFGTAGDDTERSVDDLFTAADTIRVDNANTAVIAANVFSGLGDLLWGLINAPFNFIGSIVGVVIDGVSTFGDWLRNLWEKLTGTSAGGANKLASDVAEAADSVRFNASNAVVEAGSASLLAGLAQDDADEALILAGLAQQDADDANLIAEAFAESGSSLISNYSFERTEFYFNTGTGASITTEQARTGVRSVRIASNNAYPYAYVSNNLSSLFYIPGDTGETFEFVCWVRGHTSNTKTKVNGICLRLNCFTSAGNSTGTSFAFFDASPALNNTWTRLSAKITIDRANTAKFLPAVQLYALAAGDIYYFDDFVLREVSVAAEAAGTASEARDATKASNLIIFGNEEPPPGSTIAESAVPTLPQDKVQDLSSTLSTVSQQASDAELAAGGAQTVAEGAQGNVEDTWDTYTEKILGDSPDGGATVDDFGAAAGATTTTFGDHDGRISGLEAVASGTASSGRSATVNFSAYPNGAVPNPPWTRTRFSGSDRTAVSGGEVVWTANLAGDIALICNQAEMATDNQLVTLSTYLGPKNSVYRVYGRSNLTASTAVYALITVAQSQPISFTTRNITVELWAKTNGSATRMAGPLTQTISLSSQMSIGLRCGETINGVDYPRRYYIYVNGTQVLYHSDSTSSTIGHRYAGFGMTSIFYNGSYIYPNAVSGWSVADTKAVDYVGCGIRLSCSSQATLAAATSTHRLVGNIWNQTEIPANDGLIVPYGTTGEVQVTEAGWYAVSGSLGLSGSINWPTAQIQLGVFKNGAAQNWGQTAPFTHAAINGVIYCAKNDRIGIGYKGQNYTPTVLGNPNVSNFSVAFLNNTKPVTA